ncbi:MAG: S8 family serine peptidase, partial [Bacteroidota bacterium]
MSLNTALYKTLLTSVRTLLLILGLSAPTFGQQLDHLLGELLVVPHPELSISQFEKDYKTFHGTPTQLQIKSLGILDHFEVWHIRFDHNQIHEYAFLKALQRDDQMLEVQYNHVLTNRAAPDDPLFDNQWHLYNPGLPGSNNNAQTQFPEVWDYINGGTTFHGDTIVVAIIDDGTDVDHPDLAQTHWRNFQEIPGNGIDDDDNGYIDDYLGWNVSAGIDLVQYGAHGVQVAGVLGAQGNNGLGISGTNWNIKVMHVAGVSLSESELVEAYFYVGEWRQKFNQTQG